jgi:hypothetical protein
MANTIGGVEGTISEDVRFKSRSIGVGFIMARPAVGGGGNDLGGGGRNDLGGGRWAGIVGKPSVLNTFIIECRRKAKADWSFKKLGLIRGAAFFCSFDFGDGFCFWHKCNGSVGSMNGRTLSAKGKMVKRDLLFYIWYRSMSSVR